mmetsp:Transcript_138026/g.385034  ORF Transcript_138026/g.385034 Transcript_138026/m.385034 type:complete len:545 (+) Transcript_138026:1512-3146(+)
MLCLRQKPCLKFAQTTVLKFGGSSFAECAKMQTDPLGHSPCWYEGQSLGLKPPGWSSRRLCAKGHSEPFLHSPSVNGMHIDGFSWLGSISGAGGATGSHFVLRLLWLRLRRTRRLRLRPRVLCFRTSSVRISKFFSFTVKSLPFSSCTLTVSGILDTSARMLPMDPFSRAWMTRLLRRTLDPGLNGVAFCPGVVAPPPAKGINWDSSAGGSVATPQLPPPLLMLGGASGGKGSSNAGGGCSGGCSNTRGCCCCSSSHGGVGTGSGSGNDIGIGTGAGSGSTGAAAGIGGREGMVSGTGAGSSGGTGAGSGAGAGTAAEAGAAGVTVVPAAEARAANGSYFDAEAAFSTAVMILAVSPAVEGALVAAAASRALVMLSGSLAEVAASSTFEIVLTPELPESKFKLFAGCGGGGFGAATGSGGAGGLRLASKEGVSAGAAASGGSRLATSGMPGKAGSGGSFSTAGMPESTASSDSFAWSRNSCGIPLMPNTLTVVLWRPSIAPGTFSKSFLCDRLTCETSPGRLWQSLPKAPTSQNGHAKCFAAWC